MSDRVYFTDLCAMHGERSPEWYRGYLQMLARLSPDMMEGKFREYIIGDGEINEVEANLWLTHIVLENIQYTMKMTDPVRHKIDYAETSIVDILHDSLMRDVWDMMREGKDAVDDAVKLFNEIMGSDESTITFSDKDNEYFAAYPKLWLAISPDNIKKRLDMLDEGPISPSETMLHVAAIVLEYLRDIMASDDDERDELDVARKYIQDILNARDDVRKYIRENDIEIW